MDSALPPAEGWYRDPHEQHEARWYSDGRATSLVRDGRTESHDPPPAGASAGVVPEEPPAGGDPSDLKRADDAEAGYSTADIRRAEDTEERSLGEAPFDVQGEAGV